MKKHLAIFTKEAVQRIFEGGKTVESRFSKHKIVPFGSVEIGDLVYIKPAGGEIIGQFLVKKVISFAGLDQENWQLIRQNYGELISLGSRELDDQFFDVHKNAKFGTLIFIGQVEQFLTAPIKITKKDLRGWVVL